MDNDAIMQEFASLFGLEGGSEETETETEVIEIEAETSTEEQTEETQVETETEEGGEGGSDDGQETETTEQNHQSKANFAFAELRKKNKEYSNVFKELGKAIGLPDETPIEDVIGKVQETILARQAKEQNIPVSVLQEIQELRSIVNENKQIKLENEVTTAFTDLATKYKLSSEQLVDFANHLDASNKNPLNGVAVDIEAEYLKLHYQDMVKAAVDDALKSEQRRKDKVDAHGSSKVPDKAGDTGEAPKINTVADLDRFFGGMNL